MPQSNNITLNIDPQVQASAKELFAHFGLSVSDAVNIFLHQSLLVGGLPFEVKQVRYNKETEDAMQEARDIASGKQEAKSYTSLSELLADIEGDV